MKNFLILITLVFIFLPDVHSMPVDSFYIRIKQDQKLTEAIKQGNKSKVLKLLAERDVNKRLEGGSTILLEAIYFVKPEIVKLLLDENANPNLSGAMFKDVNDKWIPEDSPLEAAVMCDTSFKIAGLLIKYGAEINDTGSGSGNILHSAVTRGVDKISTGFYSENDYNTLPENNEQTAKKKALWLIKNGADVNSKNSFGETPLYWAVSFEYYDLAGTLMDNGANAKITESNWKNLLHICLSPGLALKLIKKGADVNAASSDGLTPLHMASFAQNIEMVKVLVENGARLDAVDSDSHLTPMDWMIVDWYAASYDIVKYLISKGARVNENLVSQYGLTDVIKKINEELKQ